MAARRNNGLLTRFGGGEQLFRGLIDLNGRGDLQFGDAGGEGVFHPFGGSESMLCGCS